MHKRDITLSRVLRLQARKAKLEKDLQEAESLEQAAVVVAIESQLEVIRNSLRG